jgi:hypothetical protein
MSEFIRAIPWYAWIVVVAILAYAFHSIVKAIHRHEEKMAIIKQGKDPSSIHDDKS